MLFLIVVDLPDVIVQVDKLILVMVCALLRWFHFVHYTNTTFPGLQSEVLLFQLLVCVTHYLNHNHIQCTNI